MKSKIVRRWLCKSKNRRVHFFTLENENFLIQIDTLGNLDEIKGKKYFTESLNPFDINFPCGFSVIKRPKLGRRCIIQTSLCLSKDALAGIIACASEEGKAMLHSEKETSTEL